MSSDRIVPTSQPADLPTFSILINGNKIDATCKVASVSVIKSINRISSASIIMYDGNPSDETFEASSSGDFIPGKEIEIKAGYHSDESTIFKGIIVKHSIKIKKNLTSMLVLECKDKAVKMTIGRKSKYFLDSKDSDIAEEIIGEYDVDKDVVATTVTHKEMVQFDCTDWDFILSRADVNSQVVICDDGKITLEKPSGSESVLSLVYGATILDLEAEIDSRNEYTGVKSFSWDYSSQEIIEEEGEEPSVEMTSNLSSSDLAAVTSPEAYELWHGGKAEDSEIKAWADSKMQKSRLAKVRGRVKCQGFPDVKPGLFIDLAGLGDRFNGKAFVSGIRHQINKDNWETDIQFGTDERFYSEATEINSKPASGILPAINGLHVGVVTKLGGDPDGEDRIQVKLPIVSTEDEGIWTRIASLDAGDKRGAFFMPEIDDEVIVGFINDDPRDAVMLGMLHSSVKPAPITASDDNNEKGFVTRSEMKFIFDDDKKSITIETPGGHKVLISDDETSISIEDSNSNKFVMSSEGISMESNSAIKIKASSDIEIEGANIKLKANAEFKAEGSAGSKLESSAVTEVKGSMVKIN